MRLIISSIFLFGIPISSAFDLRLHVEDIDTMLDFFVSGLNFCNWPDPYSLEKISPEFRVFVRNKTVPTFTIKNSNQINKTMITLDRLGYFHKGRRIIFIIHGFRDDIENSYMKRIKDGLLVLDDSTVFIIGWPKGAYLNPLKYAQAASNTRTVSDVLAEMAKAMLHLDTFEGHRHSFYLYCIGHSLGAHICGQAGLNASGIFNRITGLDPAGPGFENCPLNPSLEEESAECVDAIHTDGNFTGHIDPVIPHLGALKRWGFIDFYPNGGVNQPGCSIYGNDFHGCSHKRAEDLFIYSLKKKKKKKKICTASGPCSDVKPLPDRSCTDAGQKQQMGYYSNCHSSVTGPNRIGGVFYLETTDEWPYC